MADGNAGGNNMLYFIVGGLVVVIAVGGFFLFGGAMPGQKAPTTEIKIQVPGLSIEKK